MESSQEELQQQLAEGWKMYDSLQIKAALDIFSSAAQRYPDSYEAQLGVTKTLIRMRKEDEALQAADRCIELQPERSEAFTAKGVIRFLQDKLADSQELLNKAIELNPQDPEPHLTLAQVKADMHLSSEAMEELQQARHLISHIEDDHLRRQLEASELHARTYVMLTQNKLNEAMASARELEEYEQENPYAVCLAYSNIGLMEARLKHFDQSAEYLQRAYSMNPYFYRAASALGQVLFVQGKATQAAEVLGQVIDRVPNVDAHTRHAYAAALAKSGKRQEAQAEYKAALKSGLKGLEAVVAIWNIIWLDTVGRLVVIGVVLAAIAAWIIFGKPSPSTLSFVGVLVILIVLQQLLGKKRYQ